MAFVCVLRAEAFAVRDNAARTSDRETRSGPTKNIVLDVFL